jgi:putative PIN family toxin of toxin-antitoxin system
MIKAVLDTNILVSALWSPSRNASTIINLIFSDIITPCFNQDILTEYQTVLSRPRLSFLPNQVEELLNEIKDRGLFVTVKPSVIVMSDESDRKFYDVVRYCDAYLITGNVRHYPKESFVVSMSEFLQKINFHL